MRLTERHRIGRLARTFFATGLLISCAASGQYPTANPPYQTGFPVAVDGLRITSSVALGDVDGDDVADIVVGTEDGKVFAYDGSGNLIWEFDTQGEMISGKAAIADLDQDGSAEVIVGAGGTSTVGVGGLWVISHTGAEECRFVTEDLDGGGDGLPDGVFTAPAIADLDGNDGGLLEIAFGSWDKHVRVINHDCSLVWERFQLPVEPAPASYFFDSIWSSVAIGDIDGDDQLDIVFGCDAYDASPNVEPVGGAVHALNGKTGLPLAGFPKQIDEVVWSSPALGDLTGNGSLDITVGTGYCWENAACAVPPAGVQSVQEALYAWDNSGSNLPGWPFDLSTSGNLGNGTYAFASPALADIDGDSDLEIIINTIEPGDQEGGQVYAIKASGSLVPGWPVRPVTPSGPGTTISFATSRSPVVADIVGDGNPEVILPSNWELVVFDHNGNQLSRDSFPTDPGDYQLRTNGPIGGAAGVGDVDGDGDLEVVGVGFASLNPAIGGIYVWDFPASSTAAMPWPVFRHDARNNGIFDGGTIFADGFESGNVSRWAGSVP